MRTEPEIVKLPNMHHPDWPIAFIPGPMARSITNPA